MLDRIDAKLLDLLQRDGPKPVAELGDRVGLSPSACHRRIRALEAAGIITGYAARLDPARGEAGLHPAHLDGERAGEEGRAGQDPPDHGAGLGAGERSQPSAFSAAMASRPRPSSGWERTTSR